MNKTLNVRYLIRIVVVVSVVAVAIWLVHRAQAAKVVDAFRQQAKRAEDKQDYAKAAGYLRRLLVLHPNDTDARAQMVLLLDQVVQTEQQRKNLFLEMELVLREAPDRDDVRRRVIPIAIGLGYYSDAEKHIDILLKKVPDTDKGKLYDLKGRCLATGGQYERAAKEFENAANATPSFVPAYGRLAALYRRQLNKPADADKVIKQMLGKDTNKESATAHLIAAYYYKEYGKQKEKEFKDQVDLAFKYDPTDPETILAKTAALTNQADSSGDENETAKIKQPIEEACKLLNIGIEKHLPEVSKDIKTVPLDDREEFLNRRALVAGMFEQLIKFRLRLNDLEGAKTAATKAIASFPEIQGFELLLADVYIASKDWKKASDELDKIEKAKVNPGLIALRHGRLAIGQEKWSDAVRDLETAASDPNVSPTVKHDVQAMLGESYDRMGMFDRSADAYRQAMPKDQTTKLWVRHAMQVAAELSKSGRLPDAKGIYEAIVRQRVGPNKSRHYTVANVPLARLLLSDIRQPENNKDLVEQRIKGLLAEVPEADVGRKAIEVSLLLNDNRTDEARKLLSDACQKSPKSAELWAEWAILEFRLRQEQEADRILREAEKILGDKLALLRLVRAQMTIATDAKPDHVREVLKKLAEDSGTLPPNEREKLLQGLARMAQSAGARDVADQCWGRLAKEWPSYLPYHLIRFDNAIKANDESQIQQTLADIKEVDPKFMGRFADVLETIRAARKAPNESETSKRLNEAAATLSELKALRPGWSRIPLAQATILDLQSERDPSAREAALERYRKAIDLGEKSPDVIWRAIDLSIALRQLNVAQTLSRLVSRESASGTGHELAGMILSLREQKFSDAIGMARNDARLHPGDFLKWLRLNQLILNSARMNQLSPEQLRNEEPSFVKATQIAPEKPEGYLLLVQYYQTLLGRLDKAEQAKLQKKLEQTINLVKSKLQPAEIRPTLALCYEIMGDSDSARGTYEQWLKSEPENVAALKAFTSFRIRRGEVSEAIRLADKIIAIAGATPADKNFANQIKVLASVTSKEYEQSLNALQISGALEGDKVKPVRPQDSEEEIRTRALAMGLQRDAKWKREAIKLLNDFRQARGSLSEENRLLLAQLEIIMNQPADARDLLATLVDNDPNNMVYASLYADVLIKLREHQKADAQVALMEKLQPDSFRTIELRARLMTATSGADAAGRYIADQAKNKPVQQLRAFAELMEKVGAGAAAENLFSRIADADGQPANLLELAMYYGRQNKIAEAISICDRVWDSAAKSENIRKQACIAYLTVLYSARDLDSGQLPQFCNHFEKLLSQLTDQSTFQSTFNNCMAALRNLQEKYDDAIAYYNKIGPGDQSYLTALNNLAFLVAIGQNNPKGGLQYVNRAKEKFGSLPTLLDTEAQIYIAMANADQKALRKTNDSKTKTDLAKKAAKELEGAERSLDDAISLEPTPSKYFHRALGYHLAGNRRLAQRDWRRAIDLGLKESDLHKLEHEDYEKLQRSFGQ